MFIPGHFICEQILSICKGRGGMDYVPNWCGYRMLTSFWSRNLIMAAPQTCLICPQEFWKCLNPIPIFTNQEVSSKNKPRCLIFLEKHQRIWQQKFHIPTRWHPLDGRKAVCPSTAVLTSPSPTKVKGPLPFVSPLVLQSSLWWFFSVATLLAGARKWKRPSKPYFDVQPFPSMYVLPAWSQESRLVLACSAGIDTPGATPWKGSIAHCCNIKAT